MNPDKTSYAALRNRTLLGGLIIGILIYFLWSFMETRGLLLIIPLIIMIMMVLHVETVWRIHRELKTQNRNVLQQVHSIVGLNNYLDPEIPLPSLGSMAIDPDFAQLIVTQMIETQPRHILELGSGKSTIIVCLALKKMGGGHVLSLEHNPEYHGITEEYLRLYGVSDMARVVHCPLTNVNLDSKSYIWYDISDLHDVPEIDLLIIDGPPAEPQPEARLPALPKFHQYLSKNAVILLDDARRKGEIKAVQHWQRQFDDLDFQFVNTQRGAFIIKKSG